MSKRWQYRKAESDEERFGLLDPVTLAKYKKHPVFQAPVGEALKSDLVAMGVTSGVGSMLVGAQASGFRVVGNVEWRDYYRYRSREGQPSTFPYNFPGAFMARGLADVPRDLIPGRIDFIAGHPECGRFSNLSYSVSRGNYQETRSTDASDIPLFLKIVAELRPRFFLMDDLPASFKVLPMRAYVDLLPDYDLFPEWVSNWGYGNIQKHRNRMFVVGALKSERFTFVPGEEEHPRTLKDVIGHLAEVPPGGLPNHAGVDLNYAPGRYVNLRHYGDKPSWKEVQEFMKDPENFRPNTTYFTPEGKRKVRPGTRNPLWDGFCPVLSGGYNPLHPLRLTPLSIRERAAIQGFPDDFIFFHDDRGPEAELWEPYSPDGQRGIKQTGKAMPIQFCTFVSDQVKAHIEKKPFEASGKRILNPNALVSQAKLEFCEVSGYANQDAACAVCWLRSTCHIYKANNPTGG